MVRTMSRSARAVLAGALTAVLLAAGLAVGATPAAAHTKLSPSPSCPGGEIRHGHETFSQGTVTVFIDFSSANGGTNCAWGQKQFARGTPTSMNLQLARCATGNPNNACNPTAIVGDPGNWSYYVGPVSVSSAAGRCIMWRVRVGSVWHPWRGPAHCG